MRRALSTIAICAMVFGCKVSKHKYEEEPPTKDPVMTTTAPFPSTTLTPEQLAELRAAVIAASTLLHRPELTPTDPAVVDRFVIENLEGGAFPATPKEREDYLWRATTGLTNWLSYKPEGLAYLTKRIEQRYANSVITRDGELVRIDAGVVPGKVGVWRAMLQIMTSPHIESGELIGSEVVRLLGLGLTQHPDAKTYQLEVDIPAHGKKPDWTYVYDRADDTIRMYTDNWSDKSYVTGKLGGKLDSVTSMDHTGLTRQPPGRRPIRSAELPQIHEHAKVPH